MWTISIGKARRQKPAQAESDFGLPQKMAAGNAKVFTKSLRVDAQRLREMLLRDAETRHFSTMAACSGEGLKGGRPFGLGRAAALIRRLYRPHWKELGGRRHGFPSCFEGFLEHLLFAGGGEAGEKLLELRS